MPKKITVPKDWLELGLKLLALEGPSALVVEKMSKTLKVSKTSFYWHFKTRKDFILALLDFWKEKQTLSYIAQQDENLPPLEQLHGLAKAIFTADRRLNPLPHLRHMAKDMPEIAVAIDEVETRRLQYVASLLCDEWDDQTAAIKADLLYHYFIGWSERHREIGLTKEGFEDLWIHVLLPAIKRP